MNNDKIVPVTLLLTKKEVEQFLKITRDNCKLKEKDKGYCNNIKCYDEHFKVENGMVKQKYYNTHNCLKLIEAKESL